ncbi:MAG: hypothetical protein JXA87_06730 [Thermoleophilia bacterium]|nr:hypothetical protein [Thermoleophilia bacterium]
MTLILALPATDGVALVSDTRKWLRNGSYIDAHHKMVSTCDGLVTGAGSGQLLDYVAKHATDRVFPEVVSLILHTARCGVERGEEAEWTLTTEGRTPRQAGRGHRIGFTVFDGYLFRTTGWVAGSLPTDLPAEFVGRAADRVRPILERGHCLEEIQAIAFAVFSDLYPSGLVSADFDFGTHRPGGRLSIDRLHLHASLPLTVWKAQNPAISGAL